ncbi:MAG: 30S ribosomal protein S1 [Deltaproteobacteria bacterium]|nr:30S ribosomal protein S1 [Deltaproteobacteria bacterium]
MPIHIEPSEKQKGSEFAKLLDSQERQTLIEEGSLVKGKVVQLTDDFAIVDIGFKSEGQVPLREFRDQKGGLHVNVGDEIEVLLENIEDDQGIISLSKERADVLKAWDTLVKIQEEDGIVEGVVIGKVKGGLAVDVGVKAFLPGSQIDTRPARNLDRYMGKRFRFKIIKLNKRRGNIVLSRKGAMDGEPDQNKEALLQNVKEGQVMEGNIKNVTDYGAFIDLGGFDGLLHVTDMSWGRVHHPSDLFKVGDNVKVVVLKYDETSRRVSLGYKQLHEDPWSEVEGKFPVGSRVKGKVVSLTDYGAFIELSPGIEGLVHISEISWNKKMKHPSQALSLAQEVEAIVMDCDPTNRRIALGMKQLQTNPWHTLADQCPVGSKVKGTVRNVTDFGLFVDCGVGVDGLVHISDLCWVQNFNQPQEIYKKWDTLEAVVVNVDTEAERFSLSLKQLQSNPWDVIRSVYPEGASVPGTVSEVHAGGAVVTIAEGVAGFLPKAKCPKDLKVGDKLNVTVMTVDEEGRKMHLKRIEE